MSYAWTFTAIECAAFDDRADILLSDTVASWDSFELENQANLLPFLAQQEGIEVFKNSARGGFPVNKLNAQNCSNVVAVGTLSGTLEDILTGLYSETAPEFRISQSILSTAFADGSLLQVAKKQTPEQPFRFTGFKRYALDLGGARPANIDSGRSSHSSGSWNSRGSSSRTSLGNQNSFVDRSRGLHTAYGNTTDFITFERMGVIQERRGNARIGYHVMQSVEHPDFNPDVGCPTFSLCYLFRQRLQGDGQPVVECFIKAEQAQACRMSLSSLQSRSSLDAVVGLLLDRIWIVNHAMETCSARKLTTRMEKLQRVAAQSSNVCNGCLGRKTVLDKHRTCAACKKNFCKRCRVRKSVFRAPKRAYHRESEVFCLRCLESESIPVDREKDVDKAPDDAHPDELVVEPVPENYDRLFRDRMLRRCESTPNVKDPVAKYTGERGRSSTELTCTSTTSYQSVCSHNDFDRLSLSCLQSDESPSAVPSRPRAQQQQTRLTSLSIEKDRSYDPRLDREMAGTGKDNDRTNQGLDRWHCEPVKTETKLETADPAQLKEQVERQYTLHRERVEKIKAATKPRGIMLVAQEKHCPHRQPLRERTAVPSSRGPRSGATSKEREDLYRDLYGM